MASETDLIGSRSRRLVRKASMRRFQEIDWDFAEQLSDSPFSSLHWHPCRFPSQVPLAALRKLAQSGDTVLDPFVGSGTTVAEAQRIGLLATGIDINPISCIMARAKTLVSSADEIEKFCRRSFSALSGRWDKLDQNRVPEGVQGDKWYTPRTLKSLSKIWQFVNGRDSELNPILQACFSAILLPACRETRHWGYICDNSTPKDHRERDVLPLFGETLEKLVKAYRFRESASTERFLAATIIEDDSVSALRKMDSNTFSCFVTSPPYFGVSDYVKSQRLSMEWFSRDIEPLRLREIGARSKRHRRSARDDYVNDLRMVFTEVRRLLRRNGWGLVVYGSSPARAVKFDFCDLLLDIGFRLEHVGSRQISQSRRQFPSIQGEQVILLTKQ